jgi:hypothetical protein
LLVAAAMLVACGSFENPSIVIDLRIVGMQAEPPEQVAPVDPMNPLGTMFEDARVCAIVADPGAERRLRWEMTACAQNGDHRCNDPERPSLVLGGGVIDDPDTSPTEQTMCATLPAGAELLAMLRDAIENDSLSGFGGVDLQVVLRVTPEGAGASQSIYGAKAVRYSPEFPEGRVANRNPTLIEIDVDRGDGVSFQLPMGRCAEQLSPIELGPKETIHLVPIEPASARESYVVPTFEGGSRMFTENLRYEWLAGAGDWTRGGTGGPRDGAGNEPPLDTEWESPPEEDGLGASSVPLWIIQRDERGGSQWFESCVYLTP